MNVAELYSELGKMIACGQAEWPVQIMRLEGGIPFAEDISVFAANPEDDGERVWVVPGEEHPPEWMGDHE